MLVLVEGQTEETFVRDVLDPHSHSRGLCFVPTLVVTKRVKSGPNFKGGITSWDSVAGDLRRLLRDTSAAAVTTMLDYYGLPSDFPGMTSRPAAAPRLRAEHVEAAMATALGHAQFIPYLSLHEFEALVFASLGQAGWVFNNDPKVLAILSQQLAQVVTAEDINEQPTTTPARRITNAFPSYQKVVHGPMAVEASGLQVLRQACPHFGSWLTRLEEL